jgi:hypothetical protein
MKTISDKYVIAKDSFKNVEQNGRVTGFQISVRVPYYRGFYLSMLKGIELVVDGERFSPEQISVTLGEKTYPLAQLENKYDDRWEYGKFGVLTVARPGGLAPGEHEVTVRFSLDIYYMRYNTLVDHEATPRIDNRTWGIVMGGTTERLALRS